MRESATGGRLLVREPDGTIRALIPDGALFDCADPAVSFDGMRVAFAGTVHPDDLSYYTNDEPSYYAFAAGQVRDVVVRADHAGRSDGVGVYRQAADEMTTWLLVYLGLGIFAGFVAGLFGVGGGLTIVPLLFMLFTAQAFPIELSQRQLTMLDPKTMKYTLVDTCFGTHHPQFGYDADNTLWVSGSGPVAGGFRG
jgi:hypothetical protein